MAEQVIIGGHSGTTSATNNDVRYQRLMGCASSWFATEESRQEIVPTDGIFKKLRVISNGAPGASKAWAFNIRVNANDTALSCTITGASQTSAANMINKIRVKGGDRISIQCTNTSTPTASIIKYSVVFVPDNPRESILMSAVSVTFSSPNVYYSPLCCDGANGISTTVDLQLQPMPIKGWLKKFYVYLNVAPGDGKTWTFKMRKVGTDGTVTMDATGSATPTTANDTTNVDAVAVGDRWGFTITPTSSPASFTRFSYGMVFETEKEGYSIMPMAYWTAPSASATNYYAIPATSHISATETDTQRPMHPCRLSNLYIKQSTNSGAGGSGKSYTYTIMRNSVATPISLTVSELQDNNNDVTNYADFRLDDWVDIRITPANTPNGCTVYGCCVIYNEPNQTLDAELGCGHGARIPHADNGIGLKRHMRSRIH